MTDETMTLDAVSDDAPFPYTPPEPVDTGRALTIADTLELARERAVQALLPVPLDVMEGIASFMARSGPMVPAHFRGNKDACMAVVYQAALWGKHPVAVAQKAYVAQSGGTIGYEAQLIHSLVESSGRLEAPLRLRYEGEGLQRRIVVIGRVKGAIEDQLYPSPKIANIRPRNSPLWTSDPDQQLAYYGVRGWTRRFAPSILLGIYTPEELAFNDAINVTPREAAKAYDTADLPAPSGGANYVNPKPDSQQQKGENRGGMQDQPPKSPPPPPAPKPKPKGPDPWAGIEDALEWAEALKADLTKAETYAAGEKLWVDAGAHGWFDKLAKVDKGGAVRKTLNELSERVADELKRKEAAANA